MKRTNILWIGALVLAWFFDFLFWKAAPGINFAIYALLVLAGGLLILGLNGVKPSWKSLILLVPILFFIVMNTFRVESMSMFLSTALTLGLMALLAVTFLGGRWMRYSLADYAAGFARLAGSLVARPFIFRSERQKELAESGRVAEQNSAKKQAWKRVWAVLRGVLIAIPIIAIFAGLLSSADLIFAQRLQDFMKLFRLEKLPEYLFRLVYILVGMYLLVGSLLHAAQKSRDENLIGVEKPVVSPFLGFTEAAVVLGAVVLLFALFVAIQFRYFFGGQTNIGIQGYTYSEYARRGFGELVAVAFFSLLLFLALSAVVKRRDVVQRWVFSGLGIAMVVLVGVILVSAFQRLLLYEAAYGFTRLRIYTHTFMIWLGLLLAAVVLLEVFRRERFFALGALLAAIGFAATLLIINVDATIIRQNIARTSRGESLDIAYLATLSSDSVPSLVQDFQDKSLPAKTRDAVGAVLVCRAQFQGGTERDWRSFTFSQWQAEKALKQVSDRLHQYAVSSDEGPLQATSPSGSTYDCFVTYGLGD